MVGGKNASFGQGRGGAEVGARYSQCITFREQDYREHGKQIEVLLG